MWFEAALASAVIFGIGGFLLKVSSHKQYPSGSIFTGLYLTGSSIFLFVLLASNDIVITPWLLFFSIIIGSGSFFSNFFLVKAYSLGPASLTSPLLNLSIVLVILLSVIVYEESLTYSQCAGVVSMITAVSLLGLQSRTRNFINPMWVLCIIMAITFVFMREGGLKMAHESGLNNLNVLLFGYLFAGGLAIIRLFYDKKSKKIGKGFLLGSAIGLFSSTGLVFLTYAISCGPASLIIPIFSTRNFVVVMLILVFFREKLIPTQWAALLLLLLGVVLIQL
jgi:uncharacterized membrane protein